DLHRRLELALLHGDDVTVGGVGQNNGLFLQSSPQRGDVVTQTCRTLVLHLLGGLGHAAFQFADEDRKSTRLNSSHVSISYAVSSTTPTSTLSLHDALPI